MQPVLRVITGACVLVGIAATLGLASNALRHDGLPLIRKPLHQTRAVASREQMMANAPVGVPMPKANAPGMTKPSAPQPKPKTATPEIKAQQPEQEKPESVVAPITVPVSKIVQKPAGRKPVAKKPQPVAKKMQALFTNLKDAKACFDSKNAIFLDARPIEDYEAEHIAGALWLCFESVDEDYDKVLGKTPKDQLLITYCSDQQCASAIKLADELVARGHTRVVIMLEGLPGWKDAGYPVASGSEAVD